MTTPRTTPPPARDTTPAGITTWLKEQGEQDEPLSEYTQISAYRLGVWVRNSHRGVTVMRLCRRSTGKDVFRIDGEAYHFNSYEAACAAIDKMQGGAA